MAETIIGTIWDRIPLSDIGGAVAIVAVFYVLGYEEIAIVPLLGVVLGPVVAQVFDAVGLESTSSGILFGAFVAVAGALTVLDGDFGRWLGVVLLAAGSWIVLDILYDYRHGEPTDSASVEEKAEDDLSMAEIQALGTHGRWVLGTLRKADRPLTAGELRTRTGLTEDELANVLAILKGNGTVELMGNGYVVNEAEMGSTGFVRSVGDRLLRPIRLFGHS